MQMCILNYCRIKRQLSDVLEYHCLSNRSNSSSSSSSNKGPLTRMQRCLFERGSGMLALWPQTLAKM